MLVLSRKVGESIIIGDSIEVKVLKVDGSSVKIGIVAPSNVRVYRQEIYKNVAEQNKQALTKGYEKIKDIDYLKEVLKNVDKDRR